MAITARTETTVDLAAAAPRKAMIGLRAIAPVGPVLLAVALILALYYGTFTWWWFEWTYPGSFYAHALIVPFFVGAMVWRQRATLRATVWRPSWYGLLVIAASMALLLLAERAGVATMQSVSFIGVLFGTSLALLGWPKTRRLLFPLLFISLMMPLVPDQLITTVAFPIQLVSAKGATAMLNLMTLHAVRSGVNIQLDHYQMAVEVPCSGFKTLVSLFTVFAGFAYLVEAETWKRWALCLSSAPLSLVINSLRITLIGVVGELVSTEAASWFHDMSGFIVISLAFLILIYLSRLLRCRSLLGIPLSAEEEARQRNIERAERGSAQRPMRARARGWLPSRRHWMRVAPYVVGLDVVLLAALACQSLANTRTRLKPPIATFQVPMVLTWNGVTYRAEQNADLDRLPRAQAINLDPLRIVNRDYVGSDGSRIQFFLTAGNARKVFHDPHTCSIASDAVLQDVGLARVQTASGPLTLQESHFHRGDLPLYYDMVYCYFVQGRAVQSTDAVRNAMLSQTLFGDAGEPSYFMRVFQETSGINPQQRAQLLNFTAGMYSAIGPILTLHKPGTPQPANVGS